MNLLFQSASRSSLCGSEEKTEKNPDELNTVDRSTGSSLKKQWFDFIEELLQPSKEKREKIIDRMRSCNWRLFINDVTFLRGFEAIVFTFLRHANS